MFYFIIIDLCFNFAVNRITKYGNSDRLSQEKSMLKPVAQHINNTGEFYEIKCYINIFIS
jgi:hypothetical protein